MISYTNWFTQNTSGKVQINSRVIYRDLSSEVVQKLDNNLSVTEILNWIRAQASQAFRQKYDKNPEVGALNKVVGDWNEFIATSLLSEIVLDINKNDRICAAVFALPSSRLQKEGAEELSSKFLSLFSNNEFTNNKSLGQISLLKNQIFLPSPDYIIVVLKRDELSTSIKFLLEEQLTNPDSFALYNFFKSKLHATDVKAAVSLKTSNRPDRRYQPLFEAAMIKAMGYVLQQNW